MEPYYYQTLSKAEQSSYQAMQAGLQAFAPSFPVPLLENRALTDVFMKLRLDCPQLFYAGTFQYRYYLLKNYQYSPNTLPCYVK